ncbi:MAG: hypothetical protein HPY55_05230 [Firmicutes bacterium]|nr:hypothetical protein [Bacillota bacterium]
MTALNKFRGLALSLLLMVTVIALTGCWGRRELEEIASLALLGIDAVRGESGEPLPPGQAGIEVTMGITIPRTSPGPQGQPGGGGGGAPGVSFLVINTTASNVTLATEAAEQSLDRDLRGTHLQSLIVGEDLARLGLSEVLDSMMRHRNLRHTVPVLVADGTARDVLSNLSPSIEAAPWVFIRKFIELNINRRITDQLHIHDLLTTSASKSKDAVLGIVRTWEEINPGASATTGKAGGPHISVAAVGGAVMKDSTMVGRLDVTEAIHALMLRGGLLKGFVGYPVTPQAGAGAAQAQPGGDSAPGGTGPGQGRGPTMGTQQIAAVEWGTSRSKRRVLITPQTTPSGYPRAHIEVSVELEGTLIELPGNIDISKPEGLANLQEQVARGVQSHIENLIRRAQTEFQGADIFFFGDLVRYRFMTWAEWASYEWPERFREATFEVKVTAHLRRPGLIMRDVWMFE